VLTRRCSKTIQNEGLQPGKQEEQGERKMQGGKQKFQRNSPPENRDMRRKKPNGKSKWNSRRPTRRTLKQGLEELPKKKPLKQPSAAKNRIGSLKEGPSKTIKKASNRKVVMWQKRGYQTTRVK